ncbi:hypothetical protein BDV95DRAFT_606772 [Massariosphaeria phaeospora]|uniref:AA1-like domain-containing protein n=1 Tax=Massariosphaeria phaeospora TaxID=100035 RepID=A0A7C8I6W2_9PLEO|nr:hypothetical protein BDV95DRAFT_606772 [Massariosphaeria phaeospora]
MRFTTALTTLTLLLASPTLAKPPSCPPSTPSASALPLLPLYRSIIQTSACPNLLETVPASTKPHHRKTQATFRNDYGFHMQFTVEDQGRGAQPALTQERCEMFFAASEVLLLQEEKGYLCSDGGEIRVLAWEAWDGARRFEGKVCVEGTPFAACRSG